MVSRHGLSNQDLVVTQYSFLHQRHSFSRLHLTAAMFNALMTEFRIFPRFKEFILLFGSKREDNEIAVPQLHFRRKLARTDVPLKQRFLGFGTESKSLPSIVDDADISRMCLRSQVH